MFMRRVYTNMFSRVVYPEYGVPITRAARHTAGSPAEGENRKSCLRPRVAWNETAGTRHLQDANMNRSSNMVFSCQVARQTTSFLLRAGTRARHARRVYVHVCSTFPAGLYRVARHAPHVSRVCFPMAFSFSFFASFFCRQILFTLLLHHIFP